MAWDVSLLPALYGMGFFVQMMMLLREERSKRRRLRKLPYTWVLTEEYKDWVDVIFWSLMWPLAFKTWICLRLVGLWRWWKGNNPP